VNMSIDVARRILEASKQRARELRSPVSIAIVDAGGHLVLFERMMSPYGWATGGISIAKATTAVMFNQSTDAVAQWGSGIPGFASSLATMTQGKFIMAAGGWPIRLGGATLGGIGVSGGNAPGRDDEIARAGLAAAEAMAQAISASQPSMPAVPTQSPLPGVSQPYMQQPLSAPHPPIQPTPAYPSVPQPPTSSQDFPPGTNYLAPDQDYPSNEETGSFDQFSENRSGGQS
jgi:uncharacterized protein GlcG (DUF336 family)